MGEDERQEANHVARVILHDSGDDQDPGGYRTLETEYLILASCLGEGCHPGGQRGERIVADN